jgi:hypothetical protein
VITGRPAAGIGTPARRWRRGWFLEAQWSSHAQIVTPIFAEAPVAARVVAVHVRVHEYRIRPSRSRIATIFSLSGANCASTMKTPRTSQHADHAALPFEGVEVRADLRRLDPTLLKSRCPCARSERTRRSAAERQKRGPKPSGR